MNVFTPQFCKPGESLEWFYHACNHFTRLKYPTFCPWGSSPTLAPHHRFVKARKKCLATMQRSKERFIRCEAKHTHPPAPFRLLSPLLKPLLPTSALSISLPYGIHLVILFVNHKMKLKVSFPVCLQFHFTPFSYIFGYFFSRCRASTR